MADLTKLTNNLASYSQGNLSRDRENMNEVSTALADHETRLDAFDTDTLDARLDVLEALGVFVVQRTFAFDDTDVAVEATSATIGIGSALPATAVAIAVRAVVTDWTDGSTGVFAANLGDGTDDDLFTPTELDIDNGDATLTEQYTIPTGAVTPTLTITSDVNLDTLTAGTMLLQLYYVVPSVTTVAAP